MRSSTSKETSTGLHGVFSQRRVAAEWLQRSILDYSQSCLKCSTAQGFSKEAVLAYLPDVVRMASGFLSRWSKQESIPLLGELKCFNFDISCSLIMGFDVEVRHYRLCTFCSQAVKVPMASSWLL